MNKEGTATTTESTTRNNSALVNFSGIVRDQDGATLPGAHVYYLKADGQADGQATNADGAFAFQVPNGATVFATYVGHDTKSVVASPTASPVVYELPRGVDIPEVEIFGTSPANVGLAVAGAGLLGLLLLTGDKKKSNARPSL